MQYKYDPLFQDFLQVHKKEAQTVEKLLSEQKKGSNEQNDESDEELDEDDDNYDQDDSNKEKLANKNISDMDYMKQLKKNVVPKEKKTKEKLNFHTIKVKKFLRTILML